MPQIVRAHVAYGPASFAQIQRSDLSLLSAWLIESTWSSCLAAMLLIAAAPIPKASQQTKALGETPATQQQPASDDRGTAKTPLIVKLIPSQQLQGPSQNQGNGRNDSTGPDWFLVIVGLLQLGVFAWQGWQLRRTVDATNAAAAIANKEFVSTHRPRIILREAIIGSVLEGEQVKVIMTFANIGETPGKIVRSVVDLEVVGKNPDRLLMVGSVEPWHEIGDLELAPGEARIIAFEDLHKRQKSSEPRIWKAERFKLKARRAPNDFGQQRQELYHDPVIHLVGQFLYEDETGLRRRTAFRRELIPERQRFYRLEGEPDLDYAD